MNWLQSECVILKEKPFKEKDRLVTFLAKDKGRLTGIAKSAKVLTGRGVGAFEPFTRGTIHYLEKSGSDLVTIRKCDPTPPFLMLHHNYEQFLFASYFTELVVLCPISPADAPVFYDLLTHGLDRLAAGDEDFRVVRLRFEMDFLTCLGVQPRWGRCAQCGKTLYQKSGGGYRLLQGAPHKFDLKRGVLCPACPGHGSGVFVVSPQVMEFVGVWLDPHQTDSVPPMAGVLAQLEAVVSAQVMAHLERVPRSMALLPDPADIL